MGDGDDLNKGSSSLFAVFVFSILCLFLIPYTIYKLCGGTEEESEDVKPWEGVRRGFPSYAMRHCAGLLQACLQQTCTALGNVLLGESALQTFCLIIGGVFYA